MKIVGISGSPRRDSNTEILLDRALEGAVSAGAEVEKIVLNELSFKACQECGGCDKTGVCVIRDDMDLVYKEIGSCDGVIIASPVFFASITAQAKMMIDRFQCAWIAKYILKPAPRLKNRKGIFISIAGSYRKDFFDNARSVVKAFFATLDIEYSHELFAGGIEKRADVDRDEKLLNNAFRLGKEMVIA